MPVKLDRKPTKRRTLFDNLKEENSMKIRMIETRKGSPDGIQINKYQAGEKYDLPERLAEIFLNAGWAEEDKEETIEVKNEIKTDGPPVRRAGKSRGSKKSSKG